MEIDNDVCEIVSVRIGNTTKSSVFIIGIQLEKDFNLFENWQMNGI